MQVYDPGAAVDLVLPWCGFEERADTQDPWGWVDDEGRGWLVGSSTTCAAMVRVSLVCAEVFAPKHEAGVVLREVLTGADEVVIETVRHDLELFERAVDFTGPFTMHRTTRERDPTVLVSSDARRMALVQPYEQQPREGADHE